MVSSSASLSVSIAAAATVAVCAGCRGPSTSCGLRTHRAALLRGSRGPCRAVGDRSPSWAVRDHISPYRRVVRIPSYSGARKNSSVPLKRNVRATRVVVVKLVSRYVSGVKKGQVIGVPCVPMGVVDTASIIKQMHRVAVCKETIVLSAHVIGDRMVVSDVNLAERSADSADKAIATRVVCVIKVHLLCSGFACKE